MYSKDRHKAAKCQTIARLFAPVLRVRSRPCAHGRARGRERGRAVCARAERAPHRVRRRLPALPVFLRFAGVSPLCRHCPPPRRAITPHTGGEKAYPCRYGKRPRRAGMYMPRRRSVHPGAAACLALARSRKGVRARSQGRTRRDGRGRADARGRVLLCRAGARLPISVPAQGAGRCHSGAPCDGLCDAKGAFDFQGVTPAA